MKLKTYTASTMAQALAQVRKDLGSDAMILHTRSYRTGSWLGLGGKPMVEITASTAQPKANRKPRRAQRSRSTQREPLPEPSIEPRTKRDEEPAPEIVVQRSRVAQPAAQSVHQSSAHAPEAQIEESPIDDRAALLQGLMGGTQSIDRHSTEHQPVQRDPIDDGFQATTFRTLQQDAQTQDEIDEQPVLLPEPEASQSSPVNTSVAYEPPIFDAEPDPLIPSDADADFESALSPSSQIKPAEVDPEPNAPEPVAAASTPETEALQAQIESLQKMMGQVLDSTRRTAVAVNKSNPDGALPPVEMSAPLHGLYLSMIDNDVSVQLADKFVGRVRDRLDVDELNDPTVVRHALLREIEGSVQTVAQSLLTTPCDPRLRGTTRPQVLALIGPTGVGKTTTVAKLAATAKLRHGKEVALITSDTYRIAAVEQLKTYASIIGLQLRIANSPDEMKAVIESLHGVDLIVIDTAGRSQNNHARLDELGQLIDAAQPDETHLVLSSTVGDNVLRKTAERFIGLGPDRCILTKLDEAVTTGMIAGISDRIGVPLSFVTVGQEVPEDILPAKPDRLARAVLDGPGAVVPQA